MGTTTTAKEVIDSVLLLLQEETPASPVFWSRAEILALIWEGLVEINLIAGYLQVSARITVFGATGNALQSANAGLATFSSPVIAILRLRNGTRNMAKLSIDDLDSQVPGWENDSSASSSGMQRWCSFGLTQIVVHRRVPDGSAVIRGDWLRLHSQITSESSVILLEDEWVDTLIDYAFHVARLKEGGAEFQQSMTTYARYLAGVAELAGRTAWKNEPQWVQSPKSKLADAVPRRP